MVNTGLQSNSFIFLRNNLNLTPIIQTVDRYALRLSWLNSTAWPLRQFHQQVARSAIANLGRHDLDLKKMMAMFIEFINVLDAARDFAANCSPIAVKLEFKTAAFWENAQKKAELLLSLS